MSRALVLPLFVRGGRKTRHPIDAMPGVFQFSPDELLREATHAQSLGIPAVLLFGIPDKKDAKASGAYAANGIVQQAVRLLKKELPELLVITDVCLCEYMDHGHCGIVQRGKAGAKILNDPSLKLLAQTAASHADAGADIVAPSDMMDGRVRAIRELLDEDGFTRHSDHVLRREICLGILRSVSRGGGINAKIWRPAQLSDGCRQCRRSSTRSGA